MLKSLDDYNNERRRIYDAFTFQGAKPNGIACPKCGAELLDTRPDMTLSSNPPQKDVHCASCDYTGYRVA